MIASVVVLIVNTVGALLLQVKVMRQFPLARTAHQ
jgi:hypothetical protein